MLLVVVGLLFGGCGEDDDPAPRTPSTDQSGAEEDGPQPREVTRVVTLRVPEGASPQELRRLWDCAEEVVIEQIVRGEEQPKEIERRCQIPAGEGALIVVRRRFEFEVTPLGRESRQVAPG